MIAQRLHGVPGYDANFLTLSQKSFERNKNGHE